MTELESSAGLVVQGAARMVGANGTFIETPLRWGTDASEVWHYTNSAGLIGIISGHQLWAHSSDGMNDTSEIQYGYERLLEQWRIHRPGFLVKDAGKTNMIDHLLTSEGFAGAIGDVYIVSASRRRDLLGLWQGYAGAQGYAVRLAPIIGLTQLSKVPLPVPSAGAANSGSWFEVVYDRNAQIRLVIEVLNFMFEHVSSESNVFVSHAANAIADLAYRFKHDAFEAEEEIRLAFRRDPRTPESFRPGRDGLVRYVPLAENLSNEPWADVPRHRLPLQEVMVGPMEPARSAVARKAVTRLLQVNGYSQNVLVTSSQAPFRF